MILTNLATKDDPNLRVGIIPASTTGIFTFPVSKEAKINVVVGNPGGSTFDIVHYSMSENDAAKFGISRVLAADIVGITDTSYAVRSESVMDEAGIRVTVATASPIQVEIREGKA